MFNISYQRISYGYSEAIGRRKSHKTVLGSIAYEGRKKKGIEGFSIPFFVDVVREKIPARLMSVRELST